MLSVDIKYKRYAGAEQVLLGNVQLKIDAGEFVALTGHSGCGKTTLLNIIAGLDEDYCGSVTLNCPPPPNGINVSMMFQEPLLLPWRSVHDNIALMLGTVDEAKNIATRLIQAVGLTGWENAYPSQLSLGMARRAALARALAPSPRLLLLDEPFASLDTVAAEELRALLTLPAKTKTAVLFVTHNTREAFTIADRLIIIGKGENAVLSDQLLMPPRSVRSKQDVEILAKKIAAVYGKTYVAAF